MSERMKKAVVTVVIAAVAVMSCRLMLTILPQKPEKADTKAGIAYILARETADAAENENTVRAAQEQQTEPSSAAQNDTAIQDGNFKAAFKDILISGDSLVKAIYEYGYLDDSQVMAEIGAGTKYLTEISEDIIAANPKVLVLHYGENELDVQENAVYFINRYTKCIQYLQQQLPHTVIFVDSIFPVQEIAYESEPYTVNIDYYNGLLQQMAKDLGVKYIDFTDRWKTYQKNYHDADGIHPTAAFYTEQYLPAIFAEVNG